VCVRRLFSFPILRRRFLLLVSSRWSYNFGVIKWILSRLFGRHAHNLSSSVALVFIHVKVLLSRPSSQVLWVSSEFNLFFSDAVDVIVYTLEELLSHLPEIDHLQPTVGLHTLDQCASCSLVELV